MTRMLITRSGKTQVRKERMRLLKWLVTTDLILMNQRVRPTFQNAIDWRMGGLIETLVSPQSNRVSVDLKKWARTAK